MEQWRVRTLAILYVHVRIRIKVAVNITYPHTHQLLLKCQVHTVGIEQLDPPRCGQKK